MYSIDELIEPLQEAKEHGLLGREYVMLNDNCGASYYIDDVTYDNKYVYIKLTKYE